MQQHIDVLSASNQEALRSLFSGRILALSFGSGVDSTAMIVVLYLAGIQPDVITFADTGGEKPETPIHLEKMNRVLVSWGWPLIEVCRKVPLASTGYTDLFGICVANETLPSLAFGMARRKFHELWANHSSQIAEDALRLFGVLYDIERDMKELDPDKRWEIRQQKGRPAADALHAWLVAHRQRVPRGTQGSAILEVHSCLHISICHSYIHVDNRTRKILSVGVPVTSIQLHTRRPRKCWPS